MFGLNEALDTCYQACCPWNNEEDPNQADNHTLYGECQPSYPSSPSKLSTQSIASWDNDEFSPPSSPSVVRDMKGRFAIDDMSIETEPTAVDVTMETDTTVETSFGELHLTGEDTEMVQDSPSRSPTDINQSERSIQVKDQGEYNRHERLTPGIARLTLSNDGSNVESAGCQIIIPSDCDVLLGRGGKTNKHAGNIRFRTLVNGRKAEYRDIPTRRYKAKTAFATNVMNEVGAYGGRFLEEVETKTGSVWVVAKDKKARKKCSQALREY